MHAELAAVPNSLYSVARANRVIAVVICKTNALQCPVQKLSLLAMLRRMVECDTDLNSADSRNMGIRRCILGANARKYHRS
jgi:hypothetical protein